MENSNKKFTPRLWGVHAQQFRWLKFLLGALPFVLMVTAYLWASDVRHEENPDDKLLPSIAQMVEAVTPMMFKENPRNGKYLFWDDTLASLQRLAIGICAAYLVALWLGVNMGVFSGMESIGGPFSTFVAMIPPMAVLPILFITLGVDELGKVALIFIGTTPVMLRDIYLATKALPREQLVKSLTLGGSDAAYVYRIVLPQILPRSIDTLRLNLGAAWLFLIAAEAIASTDGLGYRIFLVRRYLSMDVIIPYVAWVTLLGFMLDYSLRKMSRMVFPWYHGAAK
ncbi:MAG: ABC transporter permease subunit [Pseudomonadota bacterium]